MTPDYYILQIVPEKRVRLLMVGSACGSLGGHTPLKAIAIIPARGGSKGLPRKNVLPLCGKPLIAWTIESALAAGSVERVVVSTDDPEIAEVSRRFGAGVVMRPREISGDRSPSEEALLHALEELEITDGPLAFLQCTSPLTLPEDIDGTLALLDKADTAVTATPWHRFLWTEADQGAIPVGHDKEKRPMRQEREPQFVEVGAVYAMKVEGLRRFRRRFYGTTALHVIPPERGLEIDDETDFLLVETLMRRRLRRDKIAQLPPVIGAVVTDFDGVLTDNRVTVNQEGVESVTCHRGDGWAMSALREAGIPVLVLTKESNPAVQRRCDKLGVECLVSHGEKLPVLSAWLAQREIPPRNIVYVGNDLPDVPCMLYAGCGVAPADAYAEAKAAAKIVLDAAGGAGCIRELADLIFASRRESVEAAARHR